MIVVSGKQFFGSGASPGFCDQFAQIVFFNRRKPDQHVRPAVVMVGDVERLRIELHQGFAFFDGNEDDDGFTALMKANEQFASDFEGGRSV